MNSVGPASTKWKLVVQSWTWQYKGEACSTKLDLAVQSGSLYYKVGPGSTKWKLVVQGCTAPGPGRKKPLGPHGTLNCLVTLCRTLCLGQTGCKVGSLWCKVRPESPKWKLVVQSWTWQYKVEASSTKSDLAVQSGSL